MAQVSQTISNFTAGELSPRLLGRTDLKKYKSGVSKLENFLVQVHGGIERRPGTQYVAAAAGSTGALQDLTRLVEFQYSATQQYVLEFGVDTVGAGDHGYIRFFRLDTSSGEPILLTQPGGSTPTIIEDLEFRDTELPDLRFTQSADILYVFCQTRPIYLLKRISVNDDINLSWTYTQCEFSDGPYLSLNADTNLTLKPDATTGAIVSVVASHADPSTGKDEYIFRLSDAVAPGRSLRIEDDSKGWKIKAFTPGTYASDPDADAHATYGLWTTPATITLEDDGEMNEQSDAETGTNTNPGMRIEFLKCVSGLPELNDTVWVGRNFRLDSGDTIFDLFHPETGEAAGFRQLATGSITDPDGVVRFERAKHVGWGRIQAVGDEEAGGTGRYSSVTLKVVDELPTVWDTTNFRLGAWSDTTGYPSTGRFFQDRLWSAASTLEPQTIWASGTGTYTCYSPTTVDEGEIIASSSITATLADAQVNQIAHLVGDTTGLIALTSGGEWMGRSSSGTGAITPMDISFQKSGSYGASRDIVPIRAGTSTIFVQRDGKVVRELNYDFGQDRFVAPAISLLSEHITGAGIKDVAYQQGKSNRLWMVKTDGELITLTYEKDEEVVAWYRHPMALSGAATLGQVLSVATTRDVGSDNVWMLIKRSITGGGTPANKYYIEMLKKPLGVTEAHELAWHLDSALTILNGSPTAAISNILHLIGESVYVFADANTLGPYTVDGAGAINLGAGNDSTRVTVGLRYTSIMETLPLVPEGVRGMTSPKGKLKRAYKYFVNLYRTLGGKIGTPEQVYAVEYPTSTSSVLNTQMFEVNAPDNAKRETIIRYEQQDGNPATLLSIVTEYDHGSV